MLYDPHLELFLQVAEHGSFSKAAEANFITPSAVIKQINLLESDLGVRLFNRTHRGLTLTSAGKSLQKDAPELIQKCNEVAERAVEAMNQESDLIRIGTSPITPAEVLMEYWPQLSAILPDLKFQLVPFENNPENARMILKNLGETIDVVAGLFDDSLLDFRECNGLKLSDEPLCVAFPINHPLAQKDKLSIEDLNGQTLMMIDPGRMSSMDALRDDLTKNHPQVQIENFVMYKTEVFNECANNGKGLVTIDRWKPVHPLLKNVHVDWNYTMPYGILYSKTPDERVQRFLDALKSIA